MLIIPVQEKRNTLMLNIRKKKYFVSDLFMTKKKVGKQSTTSFTLFFLSKTHAWSNFAQLIIIIVITMWCKSYLNCWYYQVGRKGLLAFTAFIVLIFTIVSNYGRKGFIYEKYPAGSRLKQNTVEVLQNTGSNLKLIMRC